MPSRDAMKPALSSNKVNYLIWRYLQESGFSQAAVELQRAWNPDPHHTLPFASRVQNDCLKGILLLGLEYDEAHERVSKGKITKRFDLGVEDGPQYSRRSGGFDEEDLYDPASLPYGTDLHPPVAPGQNGQTPSAPDGRAAAIAPVETTTTSRTKSKSRARKGTMSKEQRPTDLMDLDTNGAVQRPSPVEGDGNASELVSPTAKEPQPEPPTTAEIGDEKDTQVDTVQYPEATCFKLAPSISSSLPPAVSIDHLAFAPTEPQAIALAGQNLARICIVPPEMFDRHADHDLLASSLDVDLQDANLNLATCNVLAFAWTPGCGLAAMAIWRTFASDDTRIASGSVVQLLPGRSVKALSTKPLTGGENIRDVVALEWNANSQCLLALSITGSSSWLRVWHHSARRQGDLDALPSRNETGRRLFHAQWIGDRRFVACGDDVVAVYEIDDGRNEIQKTFEMSGNGREWHRALYDPITEWVVLLSNDSSELGRLQPGASSDSVEPRPFSLPAIATDSAISPTISLANKDGDMQRLLVVACESGEVVVVDMRTWVALCTLILGMQRSAAACAWSPDGLHLAAAGEGRVVIWGTEDILLPLEMRPRQMLPRAVWTAEDPNFGKPRRPLANGTSSDTSDRLTNGVQHSLATMHIDGPELTHVNGNHVVSDTESQISSDVPDLPSQKLAWHSDGRTLMYTIGDQVAVLCFDDQRARKGP